jgi:hypothetical protein
LAKVVFSCWKYRRMGDKGRREERRYLQKKKKKKKKPKQSNNKTLTLFRSENS